MQTFCYKNKLVTLPESFNELSGKQLIQLCTLLHKKQNTDEVPVPALRILLNYSRWRFVFADTEMIYGLLPYITWVLDNEKLTAQVLPEYKGFYGPKAEFDNLVMKEFHLCEMFYRKVVQDDDMEALDWLVAVLYRKPKPGYNKEKDSDGDIRRPLNQNEVGYYTGKIENWPIGAKLAILRWYDGCRQMLVELYDKVFSGSGGGESDAGLYDVIHGLAGDKFGDFEKVERLNVHTALRAIETTLEQQAKAAK